ncbi:hypothetical protein [Erysipelothrix piscisicarius]|uniref:hypothetical protein n=1 Tax=Erysipelothrix piscisicarius TaxID=2485784 RepID=UPI001E2BAD68|nr:hypothetical protein [Erysipelothrix piscisicarius]
MNILLNKFKEVSFSVLPITVLVLLMHLLIVPLETEVLVRFNGCVVCDCWSGDFLGAELELFQLERSWENPLQERIK